MSRDLDVGVRITADSKGLVGESRAAKEALSSLGDTAKRTNTESAAAAERFTANLKRQSDTLGKTASEIRSYDAAQMGLNQSQRASVDASNKSIAAYERQQEVLGGLRNIAIAAGAAVGVTLVAGLKASVTLAAEAEQSHLRLAAVLRGTGHAAGLTKADLDGMAEGMKEKLGIDDDALRDSMAVLLTFRNVSKDSFGEALETSANLAAVMQTDLKSAVLQLGKALENPEEGLTALKRSGISFNETQKDMIKDLVETGNQAEAITLIMKTMKEQGLDGVAESMNQGITKATRDAGLAWDDLLKSIGNTSAVKGLAEGFFSGIAGSLKDLRQAVESGDWLDRLTLFATGIKTPSLIAKINAPPPAEDPQARAIAEEGLARQKAAQAAEIAAIAKKKADEEAANAAEEASKRAIAAARAREEAEKRAYQQSIEGSNRVIAALKTETEQIGLNVVQKKMMSAAAEAAKAPTQELAQEIMASAQAWGLATQQQEAMMAAEKERLSAIDAIEKAEKEAAKASEASARESTQRWNNLWGGVEQTAKTSFIQFAAHGKSAMQSIGESIKLSIIDVLYQLTVRKWMINIGAALGVGGGSGSGSAGGFDILAAGSNLLSAGKGIGSLLGRGASALGFSSFGAGASGAASAGVFGAGGLNYLGGAGTAMGAGAEFGGMASMGSSFAAAAGPVMGLLVADQLTKMFAGDKLISNSGIWKAVSAIPIVGVLPNLINGLFGHGPRKFRQEVAIGDVSAEGFDGRFTRVDRAKGGLLVGNKHWEYDSPDSAAFQQVFDDAIKGYAASAQDFAKTLGLSTDAVTGYSKTIRLESEKGKALTEEQINSFLRGIGNEFAQGVLPMVDTLKKAGEDAIGTLGRLSNEFVTMTDSTSLLLGKSVADSRSMVSGLSFQDRTAFIDSSGGAESLTQFTNFFADNFLTAEERLAPVQERLNEQLTKLGLSTDLTRDQFNGLVQSLGEVGGVSVETWQSLRELAPAFDLVRDASETLVEQQKRASTVLTDAATLLLGKSMEDAKSFVQGFDLADQSSFVAAAGGVDALNQKVGVFFSNLDDSDKLVLLKGRLGDALKEIGVGFIPTMDQFNEAMRSGKLTTEQFITGLNLQGLIKEVNDLQDATGGAGVSGDGLAATSRREDVAQRRAFQTQQAEDYRKQGEAASELKQKAIELHDAFLLAGDAAGALSNELAVSGFPKPDSYTAQNGQFVAGAFNAAFAAIQAANAKGLANAASSSALRVQDVGVLMGQLYQVITSDEVIKPVYLNIRNAIADGSGDLGNTVRDAVDGFAKTMATEQARLNNAPRSQGLAAVLSAGNDLSFVNQGGFANGKFQFGRDVIAYGQAIDRLDARLADGTITATEHSGAMAELNRVMGDNSLLLNDTEAQMLRIAGASMNLAQAGLESISYYFNDISKRAAELAKAASAVGEPIAKATEAIGRMKSISTVFAASAGAVLGGLAGAGPQSAALLAQESQVGSITSRAQLISEAASIAAAAMTTADASRIAQKLSGEAAFANTSSSGVRDISLLLDGLKTFDPQSFENSFLRINNALASGQIKQDQYNTLFNTALDIFEGLDDSAGNVKSAFGQLRDAAKSLADGLLLDQGLSTLNSRQSLTEAQRQFDDLMTRARGGDAGAAGDLSSTSRDLLRIARGSSANKGDYDFIFGRTVAELRTLETSKTPRLDMQPVVDELKLLRKEVTLLREQNNALNSKISDSTKRSSRSLEEAAL